MRTIVLLADNANPLSTYRLLQGQADYARRAGGWRYELVMSADSLRWMFNESGTRPDGVIAVLTRPDDAAAVRAFGKPVVAIYWGYPSLGIPAVKHDNARVGEMAAEHLLGCGLRNFAFVGRHSPDGLSRYEGFRRLLNKRGFTVQTTVDDPESHEWYRLVSMDYLKAFLKRIPSPAGVMTFNDAIGVRVVLAARELGRSVPDDIAVIGVDNEPVICEFSHVPLSSVEVELRRLGYEAARLLDRMMSSKSSALAESPVVDVLVPPLRVVPRQSTDVLAIEDADVATAVRLIRERACEQITVGEILQAVAVSRSTLEHRFKRLMGCTPGDEIRRTRVREACVLLAETNLKLLEIADRCGFEGGSLLSRAFKREKGIEPRQYRANLRPGSEGEGATTKSKKKRR